MSQETIEWLNDNVLLGFTTNRDKWAHNGWGWMVDGEYRAWWTTDDFTGAYPLGIPVEEVERRLFSWEAESKGLYIVNGETHEYSLVPDKQAIVRSDTNEVMGIFGGGYQIHQFREWLLNNVANLLDADELGIASAMVLRGGAVAAVTIELPEEVEVDGTGYSFRPSLLAATSHNGEHATGYKLTCLIPVCDNSLSAALCQSNGGRDSIFKIKHTRQSLLRVNEARQALGLLYQNADDMQAWVTELTNVDVSDRQFGKIMDEMLPIPVPETALRKGETVIVNQRSITIAENKRADIVRLYRFDDRAAPWQGTALGVLQAFNTYGSWVVQGVKGGETRKFERNTMRTMSGEQERDDQTVLKAIELVLQT